jgi:HEAT repeat protein
VGGDALRAWAARIWPAALWQFCFVGAVALLKSASNALVLARFQASALPWLYLVSAGVTAGLSLAAGPGRPSSTARAPVRIALLGAVLSALAAAAMAAKWSWAALGLYLFGESFATWAAINFWAALGNAFDAREARRAFPWINGIGMGGGIVGGLMAKGLAQVAGTNALLAAACVLLLASALVFRFHRVPAAVSAATPARPVDRGAALAWAAGSPYVKIFAGLVLAFAVQTSLVDFLFRQRAAATHAEDGLAALFGEQQLWIGLICMVFQLFFAERLLNRLGVLRYLALVPLVLAPLGVVALVSGALWPVYVLKLLEASATFALVPVTVQLLYAPMPDDARDGLRPLIDGVLRKGGGALGGLLLIGAGGLLQGPAVALALLGLYAGVCVLLYRLQPLYVKALASRVNAEEAPTAQEGDEAMLAQVLSAEDPDRALKGLALMQQAGVSPRPYLPQLLVHPSDRVQERAVVLARELGATERLAELEKLLQSGARRPRQEAAWAIGALVPERAPALLMPHLSAGDPGLRCAAVGALIRAHGEQGTLRAVLDPLLQRGEAAPPGERREVARLLGRLGDARWAARLKPYLKDGEVSVRRIALEAAGEGRYVELAPRILPFLTWREERRHARHALAQMGDRVVPLLEAALNDRARPASVRYELPRVLRRVGTQAAFNALLFSNPRDDAFLHYRVGVALARLREDHPELSVDAVRVREALARRKDVYDRWVGPFRDARAALGDEALLTRALGDRLDQALELSFWLLGLLHGALPLRRVHGHLLGKDPRRRAWALELLENLVPDEDRERIREQVEAHHRELPRGAAGRMAEHVELLCRSEDDVVRACARTWARRHGLWPAEVQGDDMPNETLARLFALEGVEIFAQCDVDDLTAVAAVAREHRFAAGERIWAEGDPGDALYIVVKGRVAARKAGDTILVVQEKQAIGDVSLLDGSPRPTDMVAMEEALTLRVDRRDFLDLISDRPELLKGVFRAVSQQLKQVVVDLSVARGTGEHSVPDDADVG